MQTGQRSVGISWKTVENPVPSEPVPQLGCTSVILIEISDFWGRVRSRKVFGACGHCCLPWLDILIPHDTAGVAVEVTVMLPMSEDGFRVKENELTGDKEPLLENRLRKVQNGWKRECFSHESRVVLLLQTELVMAAPRLSVLPHVLSPAGFWLSDEVPGVGACCSLGTLHTGPGPSLGKGACRAGTS